MFLGTVGAFTLPARVRLELYDVQDLTYSMNDFPGVEISLSPAIGESDLMTGEDLAHQILALVPGSWHEGAGRSVQFQNGLLIVRATRAQHAAVRALLAVHRARLSVLESLHTAGTKMNTGVRATLVVRFER